MVPNRDFGSPLLENLVSSRHENFREQVFKQKGKEALIFTVSTDIPKESHREAAAGTSKYEDVGDLA